MQKKVKKKKLNLFKVFIFLLILCLIGLSIYFYCNTNTKNIIIKGNSYYSDDEIIELAELEDYPKFITVNSFRIEKNIKHENLIKNVDVNKKFGFIVEINIIEKKVLYQRKSDNLYLLDTGEEISADYIEGVPLLINYYPNTLNDKALKAFGKLTQETISKISSIEYSKTEVDDERFLLFMTDGNLVYINLNRMDKLNKYTEIVNEFGTKKGILNLDSGNYFEVKEK